MFDSRQKDRGFEPHWHHCIVSLSKNINPSLLLVQPRKTCPFITERLLMGHKNQIKQTYGDCTVFTQAGLSYLCSPVIKILSASTCI